ncbi:MAG TPA: putative LPS assembly protein LptD, partial [Ferruginibacter sp.]|nr:putative LPS assembly protein LptD [Ferruginibacter sp.]
MLIVFMNNTTKGNANIILGWVCVLPFLILTLSAYCLPLIKNKFHTSLTDTLPFKKINDSTRRERPSPANMLNPSLPKGDTIIPVIDTFSFKASKDSLDNPVSYHADDSMVLDVPAKKIMLYGKTSTVKYIDNELSAPRIEYDQSTSLVKAFLTKDSLGNVIAYPRFQQADFKSVSDTIEFNMKTQRGLTKGTYTQQGEMYVYGEKIKKVSPEVFYASRARFTTCNLDTPHFAFISNKIKFINKKTAFSGPVHPEFEGVPLPIYLPFGIYPLSQGRHSGLMAPTFTANQQLGLALEGLGYYKIINEKWDVVTRGTIYSYGGWTANINPRYFRRYRYQGNFGLDLQHFKTNFKGDPDFTSSKTFKINWAHNADVKSRPGVNFSANVSAGSTKFNQQVPNNPVTNFTNIMSSSITYAKVWKDKPYNISVSANHSQNSNTGLINVYLPDVSFNVNTLYPFRRSEPIGEYKWY